MMDDTTTTTDEVKKRISKYIKNYWQQYTIARLHQYSSIFLYIYSLFNFVGHRYRVVYLKVPSISRVSTVLYT